MPPLPRAVCYVCGREVAVRVTGQLREHYPPGRPARTYANVCAGSGLRARSDVVWRGERAREPKRA